MKESNILDWKDESPILNYALNSERILAYIIDYIILIFLMTGFILFLEQMQVSYFENPPEFTPDPEANRFITGMLLNFIPIIAIGIGYFTALESSGLQASIGKYILGIKVTNIEGKKASLSQILMRTILKTLIMLLSVIGAIIILRSMHISSSNQAPQDKWAGTVVIKR